jgi:hypothetical protein
MRALSTDPKGPLSDVTLAKKGADPTTKRSISSFSQLSSFIFGLWHAVEAECAWPAFACIIAALLMSGGYSSRSHATL